MDKVIISNSPPKNNSQDSLSNKASSYYESCRVSGYSGSGVFLVTKHGEHEFSRTTGEWLAGPCLNYKDYRLMDEYLDLVQQSDGYTWTLRAGGGYQVRDPEEAAIRDLLQVTPATTSNS